MGLVFKMIIWIEFIKEEDNCNSVNKEHRNELWPYVGYIEYSNGSNPILTLTYFEEK